MHYETFPECFNNVPKWTLNTTLLYCRWIFIKLVMRWLMYFITSPSDPYDEKRCWFRGRNIVPDVCLCVLWSDNCKYIHRKREVRHIWEWPSYSLQNKVLSWAPQFTTDRFLHFTVSCFVFHVSVFITPPLPPTCPAVSKMSRFAGSSSMRICVL